MEQAGQKFLYLRKLPSTKFYFDSNWKFLNERGRPEILISPQALSNELRFRIKLKLSEWKKNTPKSYILANSPQRTSIQNQIKTFWMKKTGQMFLYLCKFSSTKFDLESNWKFLNKEAGQKFLYLSKFSSTEFDSESNSTFLNGTSRPEIFISSQTSLNEILFGLKLKVSEWKREAGNSYISASSLQRTSI